MPSPLQARRAEEKLGVILDQVDAIRARLNWLVWQGAVFGVLGWTIACFALVLLAAYYIAPLPFLGIAILLLAAMLYGLVRTGRTVARTYSSMLRAAQLTDRRGGLKGRLETIVEFSRGSSMPAEAASAGSAPAAPMWSYLIEDAIARRAEFEPARIENRRVSQSIHGLLGALVIALLAFPLIQRAREIIRHPARGQSEVTLGLNDLKLMPADPDSNNGVEVQADARTMKMLQRMMAAQGLNQDRGSASSLNGLLNRARGFAGRLQDKLTGRDSNRPRIKLKLADAGNDENGLGNSPPIAPKSSANNPDHLGIQNSPLNGESKLPPMRYSDNPPDSQSAGADNAQADAFEQESPGNQESSSASDKSRYGGTDDGGRTGSSHGAGADPGSLFGKRIEPRFGNQGFQIAIEARPMTNGSKSEGHPYVPPKVDTPLNPRQLVDEPIPRASVPEQDRAAVKSVFER